MTMIKEIKEDQISIANEFGEWLFGDVTYPNKGDKNNPAIILVPGFGVDRHESGMFDDLSLKLSSQGYFVFKIDFSGCGDSEGDYSETSLTKQKGDLKKILKFVKTYKGVDRNRIGILAQSFGTAVTLALKPNVDAIVLMGSIAHPYELMKKLFTEDFNPDGISSRKRSGGNVTKVGPQFWKDLKDYDLIYNIKQIVTPILFIHGEKDDKVPLQETEQLLRSAGNKISDFVPLKGADHGLRPKRDEMNIFVTNWFNRFVRKISVEI